MLSLSPPLPTPQIVPVEVTLRNQLVETPVDFVVTLKDASNTMDLIGPEEQALTLAGNDTVTLPYEALLSRGGTHDLQSLALTILPASTEQEEGKEEGVVGVAHSLHQQWLVHVSDSSN